MSAPRKMINQIYRQSSARESELEALVEKQAIELRRERDLNQQLREDILHVSLRAKERLGQELHADLAQTMAGASLLTIVLARVLSKQAAPEASQAELIADLLKTAQVKTRRLVHSLFPILPESGGLSAALSLLAQSTTEIYHCDCRCICVGSAPVEDCVTATNLLRIAQEAVTNSISHGHSSRIRIRLFYGLKVCTLSVKDNGSGIVAEEVNKLGMGLRIMQYRAAMIGAKISAKNSVSGGIQTTCSMPHRKLTVAKGRCSPHGQNGDT